MKLNQVLWFIVFLFAVWFLYVHLVKKVPFK